MNLNVCKILKNHLGDWGNQGWNAEYDTICNCITNVGHNFTEGDEHKGDLGTLKMSGRDLRLKIKGIACKHCTIG